MAHFNLSGGTGNVGNLVEDATAPSTLRISLDTTGGTGNWAANYYVGNGSPGGFNLLGAVADLNTVTVGSVGIGGYNADGAANFQSFELSVVGGDTTGPVITALNPVGASGVYPGAPLVATFSEDIALTGGGMIIINDVTINLANPSVASVSDNTLTISPPANLAFATSYEVVIGPGTIRDTAIPANAFLGTTTGQWTFSTAAQDFTAPLVTRKSPATSLRIMPMGDSITIATTEPNCHLIIAQIMPRYTYVQAVVDYNTWIRNTLVPAQQALGRKVTVVGQYAPFLTNPTVLTSIDQSLFSNGINHPSNPGYDKMAQVWFNAIESLGIGPGTYSYWIRGFPAVGTQKGLNDDPDGDGLENGIENFFGTSPLTPSPGIVAGTVNSAQGIFTFTHPQGVTAGDLIPAYQWSKDLQTFQNNLATETAGTTVGITTQANTPVQGTTTVTATVTGNSCDRLFLRAKVTED